MIPTSGMAGLLKSMGFDPDAMKLQLESFIASMQQAAATISANQARLEAQGARIEAQLAALDDLGGTILARLDAISPAPRTVEIFEDGKPTGVLITDEKFPQAMIDDVNNTTPGGAINGNATGR